MHKFGAVLVELHWDQTCKTCNPSVRKGPRVQTQEYPFWGGRRLIGLVYIYPNHRSDGREKPYVRRCDRTVRRIERLSSLSLDRACAARARSRAPTPPAHPPLQHMRHAYNRPCDRGKHYVTRCSHQAPLRSLSPDRACAARARSRAATPPPPRPARPLSYRGRSTCRRR